MAALQLKNIRKTYGEVEVIKGADLHIEHGEFVVFVGPSGCGKSTLLRMIAGLEEISGGELWIGEQLCNDVEPRERGIAMVFQSYALYPHMTVYDNVGFGLKLAKKPPQVRDSLIREAARTLQMEHLLERKPSQLSGGQRQRVAIGRAIVRKPEVFLFDEPLSNLDAALRVDMRMELEKLHQAIGATMIYVTHDQVEAMTLADRIVVLNGGVVQQVGTPLDLYQRPANRFVAGFIGLPKMNFLEATLQSVETSGVTISGRDFGTIHLAGEFSGARSGATVTLGIRPHSIKPSEAGPLTGRVQVIERMGHETNVSIELPSGASCLAVLEGNLPLHHGQQFGMAFAPGDAILFDASGVALNATPMGTLQ